MLTPVQLKAARLLLSWTQDDLAAAAAVGRATVNRHESGKVVGEGQVRLMRHALEAAGVVLIPGGTMVDGVVIHHGIGLRAPGVAAT